MEFKKQKHALFRVVFGRTGIILALIVLQCVLLAEGWMYLTEQFRMVFVGGLGILEAIVVIAIFNRDQNSSTIKMGWIVPILVAPVLGVGLYCFVHIGFGFRAMKKRIATICNDTRHYLPQSERLLAFLQAKNPALARLSRYIYHVGGFPICEHTKVVYFPSGEEKRVALRKELQEAKAFIFMEYFIIDEGLWWSEVLDILKQKVAEGVEVRLMVDGIGTLPRLPVHYDRYLRSLGIKTKIFSPVVPLLSTYQNNRDHRKIVVVDGRTAFTGGINIADEYINKKHPFGEWKDTAVMLKGEGVHNFTQMFLQMWNMTEQQPEDYQQYLRVTKPYEGEKGYSIAYGDNPMDTDLLGEEVYVDILRRATRYVHIMTPYLVLDDVLLQALCNTAKSGVEVRLILPEIPDKRVPNYIAKSFYPVLLENGVEIYHFTPGFIHAKSFVSDNIRAVVGSINLDFRSLCHHFECALYMEDMDVVTDIEKDFSDTLARCRKITFKEYKAFPLWHRLCGKALRILAPLM